MPGSRTGDFPYIWLEVRSGYSPAGFLPLAGEAQTAKAFGMPDSVTWFRTLRPGNT
jgi:hypothetical protein